MYVNYQNKFKRLLYIVLLLSSLTTSVHVMAIINVRMQTDLGAVDIDLFDDQVELTVDNFMNYVNDGDYNETIIHRAIPEFIIQGGGFSFDPDQGSLLVSEGDATGNGGIPVPTDNIIVVNDPDPVNRPNVRGTIAMAKIPGQADSATSDWFINLVDNLFLDDPDIPSNSGGFTVFGEVVSGMEIVDAIAAQTRCQDLLSSQILCGPNGQSTVFLDLPLVAMTQTNNFNTLVDTIAVNNVVHQYNLINVLHMGSDSDGDGVADSAEDEGPGNGDADNDSTPDRDQQNIASYKASSGKLITLESDGGVLLEDTSYMGETFGFSTYDPPLQGSELEANPPAVIDGFDFLHGHLGFSLSNLTDTAGKATVRYTVTGATCQAISSYFQYGPTPDDNAPHWYEFLYDEVTDTGAEFNGNVITLHYVDGERGDSALGVAGVIETQGGTAASADNDGLAESLEDGAPNGGDGNNDGICDSVQGNVASFPGLRNDYITIEAPPGLSVNSVGIDVGVELLQQAELPSSVRGLNFAFGFLSFNIDGLANNGDSVDIRIILPEDSAPVSYFKYGPTADNNENHLYEFLFDPVTGTGAEFNNNEVILHFVDGERGDSDLMANGVITDPGAPALFAASVAPSNGGSSGCSLGNGTSRPGHAGAWYLLLFLSVLQGMWRYYLKLRPRRVSVSP